MRTSAMAKLQIALFFGFVGLAVGWLAIHERDTTTGPVALATSASASASASAAPSSSASAAPEDAGAPEAEDAGDDMGEGEGGGSADGGSALQELTDAPKAVRFGVILFRYEGAELAPEKTRPKEEAEKLAKEVVSAAKDDFEEAAKKGDKGSTADAGRMYRGILEPEVEYALFSLDKGSVSEVIDTPRGFWVVKRLD